MDLALSANRCARGDVILVLMTNSCATDSASNSDSHFPAKERIMLVELGQPLKWIAVSAGSTLGPMMHGICLRIATALLLSGASVVERPSSKRGHESNRF